MAQNYFTSLTLVFANTHQLLLPYILYFAWLIFVRQKINTRMWSILEQSRLYVLVIYKFLTLRFQAKSPASMFTKAILRIPPLNPEYKRVNN